MKQLLLTLVKADSETPEAYVIAVTQYNTGGDVSLIFLHRSKWPMLTCASGTSTGTYTAQILAHTTV